MKNLYITGGLGQDGKILTKIISKKKFKIFVLTKKKIIKKSSGVIYIKTNLLKKEKISTIFNKNKPDIILHLAANNPAFKEKNYKKFYLENIKSSFNLFNESYKINNNLKFIFTSSVQIFEKKYGLVNENSKIKITTPYTKFRIEFDNFLRNLLFIERL